MPLQKTILAIEDDPNIAELLEVLLASDELHIINIQNGKEALSAVLEHKPDLVLLDIMLPNMNGWEVFDQIRAHAEVSELPIVVLTVTQSPIERRDIFTNSKINFFISKPFDVLAVRKKINEVLQVSQWRVGNNFPKSRSRTESLRPIGDKLRGVAAQTGENTPVIKTHQESVNGQTVVAKPDQDAPQASS
jgi:DNA-binding response OmpR family regulator